MHIRRALNLIIEIDINYCLSFLQFSEANLYAKISGSDTETERRTHRLLAGFDDRCCY